MKKLFLILICIYSVNTLFSQSESIQQIGYMAMSFSDSPDHRTTYISPLMTCNFPDDYLKTKDLEYKIGEDYRKYVMKTYSLSSASGVNKFWFPIRMEEPANKQYDGAINLMSKDESQTLVIIKKDEFTCK